MTRHAARDTVITSRVAHPAVAVQQMCHELFLGPVGPLEEPLSVRQHVENSYSIVLSEGINTSINPG